MKKSLLHLPKEKREDLKTIVRYVLEAMGDCCEMIILYGSYARGTYVEYDQRTEYGVRTLFMSDYDILVVTNRKTDLDDPTRDFDRILEKVEERFYKGRHHSTITPIEFIHETIGMLNQVIERGYYFYTDIEKEGIMLYDSGNCKLARQRKRNFREIKELSQEFFEERFERAGSFLRSARHDYNDKDYRMASFHLHQACENLYFAVILTFTQYSRKEHNLNKLSAHAASHSEKLLRPFPRDTPEEKRLFLLLVEAYVQARYNPKFVVTEEDIGILIHRVNQLRDITEQVCDAKIAEYDRRARA